MITQFKQTKTNYWLAKKWQDLLTVAKEMLDGKKVIALEEKGITHLLSEPKYLKILHLVDVWVFGSTDYIELAEKLQFDYLLFDKEKHKSLEEFIQNQESQIIAFKQSKKENPYYKIISEYPPNPPKRNRLERLIYGNKKQLHIEFKFVKGPWGGGNQFLKALKIQLEKDDWRINKGTNQVVSLINAHQYREGKRDFLEKTKAIHRIDGPMRTSRGIDAAVLDDQLFEWNAQVANCTVFQSFWSFQSTLELGYYPVNPVVIPNASDATMFNQEDKIAFSRDRKIRLIATSWSTNPLKGGKIYKWLDENLDFNKYDFTFVGRSSETFKNIKLIPALETKKLAKIVKQQDIYITASANEACSNSLIEALTCGLPAIYLKSASHPELVKNGGLGFEKKEEIPQLLVAIVENYGQYQAAIEVLSIEEVAEKYISCFEL